MGKHFEIMDDNENDFNFYNDQDLNNDIPDANELDDEQMLSHINANTLLTRCYLTDDAFSGETQHKPPPPCHCLHNLL